MTQLEQIIETIKDWERDIRFPNDDREAVRKDALCEVLDYLTSLPSLPEGLDETAEKELKRYYAKHDSGMLIPRKYRELALHFANFGAKWMAGQGITKEGIVDGYGWFIDLSDNTHIDLDPCMARRPAFDLKDGEEVIIQIRKK